MAFLYNSDSNPDFDINHLTIAERDKYLTQIQSLIELKKKMLLDKRKHLKHITKDNKYLQLPNCTVLGNCDKYYENTLLKKQKEMRALEILREYTSNLSRNNDLTIQQIQEAKNDQKQIVSKLNYLKNDLDKIIQSQNE
jgi:hypothetical protein